MTDHDIDPEAAYRRACAHWHDCATCSMAGGETAEPAALCPDGRVLAAAWEAAEDADADRLEVVYAAEVGAPAEAPSAGAS